tara:strand:- start:462 stop:2396 length:1935 start_codon:yes stop_codon:yes gene_type:complete
MVAEYGLFFLILSVLFSSIQFLRPFFQEILSIGFFRDHDNFNNRLTKLTFFSTLISFVCLTFCFLNSDFTVDIVSTNSNSQLPTIYKITGVWGNHEGSILLWLLVMTFFGFLFSKQKIQDIKLKENVLILQAGLCFLVGLFVIFTSNPFWRTFPPVIEGKDLNPLLQDPGLAIHPPILYLGYVGFSIVYSLALATLLKKEISKDFVSLLKPWVFLSWSFLTLGIGLGSWWAYYELGWGGFWFWDPVENASLLPWLTGTALLHSIIVAEKRKKLITWSIILSIVTFCLSLLGTFLVRSGVLTSVHAFANDPKRGLFILVLLVLVIGLGLILYWKNSNKLLDNKDIEFVSREGAISLNNIFMLTITGTVLLGTVYPLFTEAFFDKKISVGAPFFNKTIIPFILPMVIGMMVGPFMKWGKDDLKKIFSRLRYLFVAIFLICIIFWFFYNKGPIIAILFILLGFFLGFSSIFQICELIYSNYNKKKSVFKIPLRNFSQAIAHFGLALFIIGSTGTSIMKKESIQFQQSGEAIEIANYKVVFLGVEDRVGPNFISSYATFNVLKNDKLQAVLNPEKRQYNMNKQVTTEAAIYSTFLGDIYIAIGERSIKNGRDFWTTRIWFNSYTIWIWIGIIFMVLGGLTTTLKFFKK